MATSALHLICALDHGSSPEKHEYNGVQERRQTSRLYAPDRQPMHSSDHLIYWRVSKANAAALAV